MSRRAFTLIELLVIVAILAVMAAILYPVFAQAKVSAKKTECMTGEKQIGTTLGLYAQDADDSLPMAYYAGGTAGPRHTTFSWNEGAGKAAPIWADLVLPYTRHREIFKCPGDSTGLAIDLKDSSKKVPGNPLSYALNYYFYRQPAGVKRMTFSGGGVSEIPMAGNKILLCETASDTGRELMRPDLWKAADGSSIFDRHLGGTNYVYADLHAVYQKMPARWKDSSLTDWETPEKAQKHDAPQWFPWLETKGERW